MSSKGSLFSKTRFPLCDGNNSTVLKMTISQPTISTYPDCVLQAPKCYGHYKKQTMQVGDWVNSKANLDTIQKNPKQPVDKRLSGPQS
jgi:hypothetical protein